VSSEWGAYLTLSSPNRAFSKFKDSVVWRGVFIERGWRPSPSGYSPLHNHPLPFVRGELERDLVSPSPNIVLILDNNLETEYYSYY
jgi:hypothetical protein